MELLENLPFGLVLCQANGEQVTITALSDRELRLRLDGEDSPSAVCLKAEEAQGTDALRLSFLRFREALWEEIVPVRWRVLSVTPGRYGAECRIEIDDPAYRAAVFRALGEFAEYIRLKAEEDDGTLARELTGLPDGGETSDTLDLQKKAWFGSLPGYAAEGEYMLALSVDRPDTYERFLTMPFAEFQRGFFRRSHLDGHPLFAKRAECVYIGNPSCFRLLPGSMEKLLLRAKAQNLRAVAVLPPVRESRRGDLDALLGTLARHADEVAANDWGTLLLLRRAGIPTILGQQMNRRRKDPRMPWKLGYARDAELLAENSLNDPLLAQKLRELGVERYEYEACIAPVKVAPGRHRLHLPFFQTNTSHACPLAAACEGSDPGLPRDDRDCAMLCLERALLYPDGMRLVGRYNSLYGVDRGILADGSELNGWLRQGIDRVVAELL